MQFEIKDKAMTELSVSILSADLANLAAETADSMVCGADMVHFDVMDLSLIHISEPTRRS